MDGVRRDKRIRDWRQSLAAALWAGLILLVVVLYARKRAGGFEPPDSAFSACLVAVLALGPSLFALSLCRASRRRVLTRSARAVSSALTVVPPLALGAALLPAGSPFGFWFLATMFGIFALALVLVGAARADKASAVTDRPSFAFTPAIERRQFSAYATAGRAPERVIAIVNSREAKTKTGSAQGITAELHRLTPSSLAGLRRAEPSGEGRGGAASVQTPACFNQSETMAPTVDSRRDGPSIHISTDEGRDFSQQLVRSNSMARGDVLEGSVKVAFAVGQRQANVHIPFVPPFAAVPSVECEMLDGCEVRLKVGTVQTFGTRIEVKRVDNIDVEASAEIGFAAVVADPQAHAA